MNLQNFKERFVKLGMMWAILRGRTVIYNATIYGIPKQNTELGYMRNSTIIGGEINKNGYMMIKPPDSSIPGVIEVEDPALEL